MPRRKRGAHNDPTQTLSKIFTEILSFFKNPALALMAGLLCASLGLRMLPKGLAADPADSSGDDRRDTFQILADGTQDLAALVGLFATDSVERYSVDYSRGYLSVAVATCSLLGILGYVRALVKLAMGSRSCQDSAFPTAPVRSILGVAESDRLPKDELYTVTYISRRHTKMDDGGEAVSFTVAKKLNHTEDSFLPIKFLRNPWAHGTDYVSFVRAADLSITHISSRLTRRSPEFVLVYLMTLGCLLLTAAATSFLIIPLSKHTGRTWSSIMGSYGLFFSLSSSSVLWSYVYIREQFPLAAPGHSHGRETLPRRLNNFAIIQHPGSEPCVLTICNLHAIDGTLRRVCKFISFLMSAMISLGYICQYIEIRKSTAIQAAWWLGAQTILACFRIAVWIWDPEFDDYQRLLRLSRGLDCSHPSKSSGPQKIEVQDLVIIHFPLLKENESLGFPVPLLSGLEGASALSLFKQMNNFISGEGVPDIINRIGSPAQVRTKAWRITPKSFSIWLGILSGDWERVRNPKPGYGCLIAVIGGQIMLLPFSKGRDPYDDDLYFMTSSNSPATITYEQSYDIQTRLQEERPFGPVEFRLLIEYHQPPPTPPYIYHNPRELMEDLSSVITKMDPTIARQRQKGRSTGTTATDCILTFEDCKGGGGGAEAGGGGEPIKEVTIEIEGPDSIPSTEPTFTPVRGSTSRNRSEHPQPTL